MNDPIACCENYLEIELIYIIVYRSHEFYYSTSLDWVSPTPV